MSRNYDRTSSGDAILRSRTLHCLHCALFFALIVVFEMTVLTFREDDVEFDPWTNYGTVLTLFLYFVRYVSLTTLPYLLSFFVGIVFYNAFPPKVKLRASPIGAPFICFRTVTCGDFPNLVRNNVQRNLELCKEVGLKNFHFEVVTYKSINLAPHEMVRETVVPKEYRTKLGTLFKARSLQYCLEDGINKLADDNWIVHLDEDTLMTDDAVRGILNFVVDGKHPFGQGLNTYADGKVVNWFTTLADSYRVSNDMGMLRCLFKLFHKPLYGWKGSYMVNQVGPERSVSFDFGPDGSIIEDCFFAFKACEAGYSFDFVDGHMMDQSPFTISDLIQQRKRWIRGSFLLIHSNSIQIRTKIWFAAFIYSIPFTASNLFLSAFLPVPCPLVIDLIFGFIGASSIYIYVYGAIRNFSISSYGKMRCLLCVFGTVCMLPFTIVVEHVAIVSALFERKHTFYVVNKTMDPSDKSQ